MSKQHRVNPLNVTDRRTIFWLKKEGDVSPVDRCVGTPCTAAYFNNVHDSSLVHVSNVYFMLQHPLCAEEREQSLEGLGVQRERKLII